MDLDKKNGIKENLIASVGQQEAGSSKRTGQYRKMNRQYYSPEKDGFYGAFYECSSPTEKAMILMLGDAVDDRMAMSGVKWLHRQECHVMAMSPDKKDYGHHNYPLERFGKAIGVLEEKGCRNSRLQKYLQACDHLLFHILFPCQNVT